MSRKILWGLAAIYSAGPWAAAVLTGELDGLGIGMCAGFTLLMVVCATLSTMSPNDRSEP